MFVQISPNVADLGETLCSLNFASRVRGVEHGPARKQADLGELFKYKQLVRDLENQLAEERKTRLKQESRALSAVSTQSSALSSLSQSQRTTTEKKPPLAPTKLRLPLRRITNVMPTLSPAPLTYKIRNSMIPLPKSDKENSGPLMGTCKSKALLKPKCLSIAVRPATTAKQVLQPKRRASIATLRPESNLSTPLNRSSAQIRTDRVVGRQSFVWDPQRVWRTTARSPLPQLKGTSCATVDETPINPRSRKFIASPPSQAGSWRPKHPTVVALQKKQLIWSPLKMKAMRNGRKSFVS